MICRGCELEISGTLLTVDLRIMDMSEFDVILGMDWLTTYRVVIDCEHRRVTAYTQDGTCDAPNPGCPLTTHQPTENLYISYHETHT